MTRSLRTVEVEVEVVAHTQHAWRLTDGYTTVWIPKSQTKFDGDPKGGRALVATIPYDMAMKKGLI